MKVVLVSQVPPAVHGLTELLRALGHKPVALLCSREHAGGTETSSSGWSVTLRKTSMS